MMATPIASRHTTHVSTIKNRADVGLMKSSRPQDDTKFAFAKTTSYEFGMIGVHIRKERLP